VWRLVFDTGLRVFADRLEDEEEREWTRSTLGKTLSDVFRAFNDAAAGELYSRIGGSFESLPVDVFRKYVELKMKAFTGHACARDFVFFDEYLEVVSRIERRTTRPGGHALVVGLSGTGKSLIPSFVGWYSGHKVFRLRVHRGYTPADFDADLRRVLRTCANGPAFFIVNETDITRSVFTERLNVLLVESRAYSREMSSHLCHRS